MFDQTIPYNEESAAFISKHSNEDPRSLLLKFHGRDLGFDIDFAILQIECRRKTARKLAPFLKHKEFLFPTAISAEQASHSAIANFHASLIPSGASLLDMTAGLGIDMLTMALKSSEVWAIELDPFKCEVLRHNSDITGNGNIRLINADSIEWLNNSGLIFDTIFIDPARRDSSNSRLYGLTDCLPNVVANQDLLRQRSSRLIIKCSPLLDISRTLIDLKNVRSIRAISVDGECKEVLVEISGNGNGSKLDEGLLSNDEILKEAIDLSEDGSIRSRFSVLTDNTLKSGNADIIYATEEDIKSGNYLYEPNASMMKIAPWAELQQRYPDLMKLAPSSHLFISEERYEDFPGRILQVDEIITGKDKKRLKGKSLNVVTRNYPIPANDLRKSLGLKEGKDDFLIATRIKKPIMILAHR